MKKMLLVLSLLLLASICLAQIAKIPPVDPAATEWVTFTRTSPTTGTVTWAHTPQVNLMCYYLSLQTDEDILIPPFHDAEAPDWNYGTPIYLGTDFLDTDTSVTVTWPNALDPTKNYIAYVGSVSYGWAWSNASSSFHNPYVPPTPTYDFPDGDPTEIGSGAPLGNTIQMIGSNANGAAGGPLTPPAIGSSFVPEWGQFLTLLGAGPWTMTITTTYDWIWIVGVGVFAGPTASNVLIPVAKDQDLEIQAGGGGNPTLPVELSTFNATLTAQNFVKLSWVSESETNMLGYRVYRSENAEQANATMITPIMIEATNTSSTASYSLEDREVNTGNTYYYWLEAVDFGSSQFFGPQSVVVTADVTPELPVQSALKNAYPNPFKADTNIEVAIKAGEAGTINIYNIAGQLVKTFSVSEGSHNVNWNGRDSKGNLCGSGIYYYQLSTPSLNQTRKMVIVK